MSRRIETRTEITDKDLAVQALEQAGIDYSVSGNFIYLKSGDFENARIDLRNGSVVGDSDYAGHSETTFGILRQYYSEAKVRDTYLKEGVTIEGRDLNANGEVVLTWSMS